MGREGVILGKVGETVGRVGNTSTVVSGGPWVKISHVTGSPGII